MPVNANAAAAANNPATQATNAQLLAQARAARQVPASTKGKGKGKGAPAEAKVEQGRKGRPNPSAALRAAAAAAKGLRRNATPANTKAQAKAAAAYAQAAQVVHVARRHNGVSLAGTHYAMRKVATGKWLVQVAPTNAYVPAQGAPVLGIGTNLAACVQVAAAHRATSPKGTGKGKGKGSKRSKPASKPAAPAQAPAQASTTPAAQ